MGGEVSGCRPEIAVVVEDGVGGEPGQRLLDRERGARTEDIQVVAGAAGGGADPVALAGPPPVLDRVALPSAALHFRPALRHEKVVPSGRVHVAVAGAVAVSKVGGWERRQQVRDWPVVKCESEQRVQDVALLAGDFGGGLGAAS